MRFRSRLVDDVVSVIRTDLDARSKRRHQPSTVALGDVRVELSDSWTTPPLRGAIYAGFYEGQERRVVEATLKPDDVYVELGGGIGVVGTLACSIVGDKSVHIYEANPWLVPVIEHTASLNGFHPAVTNAALGELAGPKTFYVHADFWMSSFEPTNGGAAVEVPVRDFAEELERVNATYLMVDIEGGERELFDCAVVPRCVRALCMEVHPAVIGRAAVNSIVMHFAEQGLALDLEVSGEYIAYFVRLPAST